MTEVIAKTTRDPSQRGKEHNILMMQKMLMSYLSHRLVSARFHIQSQLAG